MMLILEMSVQRAKPVRPAAIYMMYMAAIMLSQSNEMTSIPMLVVKPIREDVDPASSCCCSSMHGGLEHTPAIMVWKRRTAGG